MINDPAGTFQPQRVPWWMLLIQISPLIIQLVGEAILRAQGVPATIEISSGSKPLFEVVAPSAPDVGVGQQ